MATVEDFVLKVRVEGDGDVKNLSGSIQGLNKSIAETNQAGQGFSGIIGSMTGRLGGMLSVATAVAAAVQGLRRGLDLGDELADLSNATNISAGALMNFRQSVIEAGGKADDFATIAAKLNQSVQEAAAGNDKAKKAFQDLGIFVRDAGGNVRNTGDILRDITEKFRSGEIGAKDYAAAYDILGKQAAKLDLKNLNAINDPFKDEQIKQIEKYRNELDKLGNFINEVLVRAAGAFAEKMNQALSAASEYSKKVEEAERKLNERGLTSRAPSLPGQPMQQPIGSTGLPDIFQRRMTEEEKAFLARQQYEREMARLMAPYKPRSDGRTGGDYGGPSEAELKALEQSEKRIAQARIEIARAAALEKSALDFSITSQGANERMMIELKAEQDIKNIRLNAAKDAEKATVEIRASELLTKEQKEKEIAEKIKEINGKAALEEAKIRIRANEDVIKNRMALNARIFAEEQAQREQTQREIAAEDDRIKQLIETSRQIVVQQEKVNKTISDRINKSKDIALLSDRERANEMAIFDIEQERKRKLEEIEAIKDLPYEERLIKEAAINRAFDERIRLTREQQQNDRDLMENFKAGFQRAYNNYVESSKNAFEQATNYFNTFTRAFEDAWVKMIETGKFAWKDLVKTMIAELARVQARRLMQNILGATSLGGGQGLFGGAIIPGFLAEGGVARSNKPYIVGEKGPELFVPNTTGTVIPNDQLTGRSGSFGGTTMVTYNINAVDALSFKAMVARDPGFIHSVAQQGASGVANRR